ERVVVAERRVPGHAQPVRLERLLRALEQAQEVADGDVAPGLAGVLLAARRVAVTVALAVGLVVARVRARPAVVAHAVVGRPVVGDGLAARAGRARDA